MSSLLKKTFGFSRRYLKKNSVDGLKTIQFNSTNFYWVFFEHRTGVTSSVITNTIVGFLEATLLPQGASICCSPCPPLTEERYRYHLLKPRPPPPVVIYSQEQRRNSHKRALGGRPIK